nr:MAG TPA_asm: hypothetical protein [Caudoviricetes sp.]
MYDNHHELYALKHHIDTYDRLPLELIAYGRKVLANGKVEGPVIRFKAVTRDRDGALTESSLFINELIPERPASDEELSLLIKNDNSNRLTEYIANSWTEQTISVPATCLALR